VIIEKWANYGGFETRELIVDGVGSPVILLHGFADSAETWLAVLAGLAEQGRAAHAYDLPGFGSADALDPGPVLVQLDRFVSAVVATHRAGGPVLIGNSLGAILALRAACEPDTSIKKTKLLGGTCSMSSDFPLIPMRNSRCSGAHGHVATSVVTLNGTAPRGSG